MTHPLQAPANVAEAIALPRRSRTAHLARYAATAMVARWLATGALAASLTACITPTWQQLTPNMSQADVQARLGKPPEVYPLTPGVTRWLYPTKPFGEETIAADFDAQGRLLSTAQVLSTEEFNKALVDKWTKTDVLHHYGEPVETSAFARMHRDVWTYRYKQDGAWFSMMNFYFDPEGVLRTMQVSPDPLHERRDNTLF